jgi:DASH complex subunit DAM1
MEALKTRNASKAREQEIAAVIAASSNSEIPNSVVDKTTLTDADTTYAANVTTATGASSNKSGIVSKKKVPKAKLSAKEKKERSVSHRPRLLLQSFFDNLDN